MKTILFSFIFCLIHFCLIAQPGTLDSSFGVTGTIIGKGYFASSPHLTLQSNGKFVAAGIPTNFTAGFLLIRYNINGSIDSSFGYDGKVITTFFSNSGYCLAVHTLPNDKIIAAGGANNSSGYHCIAIARYNKDGRLDNSFGINGKSTLQIIAKTNVIVSDMAIQEDGKIVVAGTSYTTLNDPPIPFIVRFNSDGNIDISFGSSGKVFNSFNNKSTEIASVLIQSDNKILIGGTFNNASKFMVARYLNSGIIDSSFGMNGISTVKLDSNSSCQLNSIALQKDGNIVCGGFNVFSGGTQDIALTRFKSNGETDSTFNHNGILIVQLNKWSELTKVLIQDDGKILGIGNYGIGYLDTSEFLVTRYNQHGDLDRSFGKKGGAIVRIQDLSYATDALIQTDKKILVAGNTYLLRNKKNHFGFARFNNNESIKINLKSNVVALNNNITLYPNPVNNILTIKGLTTINNYQLIINNSKGNVVATKQVNNLSSYQFNVQNLSSGAYYVNVVSNNKVVTTLKFVKE